MLGLPGEIAIFTCWVGLFSVFTGLGLLIRRTWGLKLLSIETLLLSFWMGWVASLGLLQLWHFWWKIDGWVLILVTLTGSIGLVWNAPALWVMMRKVVLKRWKSLCLVVLLGFWLANRVLTPIQEYDTGLYHLASIKWASLYPVVPGLGNVHGRLAFNSTFFLYAAMLDVGPWNERTHYLANGLLMYVFLIQLLVSLFKISVKSKYRSYYFYYSLFLIPTIPAAFGVNWILGLSPFNLSPDVSVFILSILLSGQTLAFLLKLEDPNETRNVIYDLVCIVLLAVIGVTVKLNFSFLSGVCLLLVFGVWFVKRNYQLKYKVVATTILAVVASVGLLIPWMIRNVILSGYLIYPVAMTAVPVPWQIPRSVTIIEANAIRGWGRQSRVFWGEVIGNMNWLQSWFDAVPNYIIMPLELTLLALLGIGVFCGLNRSPRTQQYHIYVHWLLLLPPIIAIILWFISSPNPRFAGSLFWILSTVTVVILVEQVVRVYHFENLFPVFSYFLFVLIFLYVSPLRNPLWIAPVEQNRNDLATAPVPDHTSRMTNDGLVIYIPTNSDQCWNAPVPCTPAYHFRSDLQLREPGLFHKGFTLRSKELTPSTPTGFTVSPTVNISLPVGWYNYDSNLNLRWMQSPAQILLYMEQTATALLSITPAEMNTGNALGERGQLKLTVNHDHEMMIPVVTGVTNEVLIPLRQDFNILQLELMAGNIVPAEVLSDNSDTRPVSIAFSSIKVTLIE
jgi:hypothetical protein